MVRGAFGERGGRGRGRGSASASTSGWATRSDANGPDGHNSGFETGNAKGQPCCFVYYGHVCLTYWKIQILLKLTTLGGALAQAGVLAAALVADGVAQPPLVRGVLWGGETLVLHQRSLLEVDGVTLVLHPRNLLEVGGVTHPLVRGVL